MSGESPGKAAAAALAEALARTLQGYEAAPAEARVRKRLPHPFSNMSREVWAKSIQLWRKHGAPLLQHLPPRPCPTCGGVSSDHIFDSYDAYPYHECQSCRTWFVPLDVRHDLFEHYFEILPEARRFGDYTDTQAVDPAAQAADRQRFDGYYTALLACLAGTESSQLSALDVGCGVANSLAAAAEFGFAAEGLEVNQHAVALARKLGRKVHFPGELEGAVQFDAVTMWETLEHIADPLAALQDAHRRLKPDGLLALTVPNLNAPDIRSMRGDSLQIHGGPAWPGHINLWNPETLSALLRRAGFEPVHMSGQFSTNLEELAAYHLGHWSGARDYLRVDSPEFELPAPAHDLISSLGTAWVTWQEGFAFAPILFVLARRADGRLAPGFEDFTSSKAKARATTLAQAYSLSEAPPIERRRGEVLDLSQPEWASTLAETHQARLHLRGVAGEPFAYLWKSQPIGLVERSRITVRGVLYGGGLSAGLLAGGTWCAQSNVPQPGPFEVFLDTGDHECVSLIFSNNDSGSGPADAAVDAVELISPA